MSSIRELYILAFHELGSISYIIIVIIVLTFLVLICCLRNY